jgi:hypothetical protein
MEDLTELWRLYHETDSLAPRPASLATPRVVGGDH